MHYTLSWKSKFDKQSRGQHDGFMTGSADTTWELEPRKSWRAENGHRFFLCDDAQFDKEEKRCIKKPA